MSQKSGRSKLTQRLRESLALVREAEQRGMPLEAVAEEREEAKRLRRLTRREFLGTAAATAGLALVHPLRGYAATSRVAVVGAGLAGLRFAHAMWTVNGIATTVYEANSRLGGRQWTNRGFFAAGQIAEHGGEFISSEHTSMRYLAAQFGLSLDVVNGGADACCSDVAWLDNAYYSMAELGEDLDKVRPALNAAYASAPFPTLYNAYTQAGYALDHMSAADWIDQNVTGGSDSKLGRVLLTDLLAEYGGEPAVQSALNLIYLLGGSGGAGGLAGTDEKYHVKGGNDQIAGNLAKTLPQGSIQTGMSLLALKQNSDGTYTCTFQKGAGTVSVVADHVVLSLPFPQLKKVDLSQAGFSAVKMLCIDNYALGTNAKLALQFNRRPWVNPDGFSGVCYTEPQGFQESWDATVSQPEPSGILERYPGGNAGGANAFPGAAPHGVAPERYAHQFLNGVEAPFPGCQAQYNGKAWLDWWEQDPFIGGAYGCYQVGNYTQFAGVGNERQGNVHFCGEATDLAFQGFMEGAVRSAERLAFHWPRL
jgi:monoamine oxidase